MIKHIVKRHGHRESYDKKKVYASVYAAALNAHYSERDAERLAKSVMKKVNAWVKNKAFVSSSDIRNKILMGLKNREVALLYKHHLDVC